MRPNESFIEQPVRSLQTMLRVLSEDDQRLPPVVPDGIYGPNTTSAVSAFQRQNGLPVTGVTNQQTWDQIVAQYEPALIRVGKAESIEVLIEPGKVFSMGETDPYLYLLQSMLTQLSKDHSSIDAPNHNGILDESTSTALRQFQNIAGLPSTGLLDRVTWKHIVKQFELNAHHKNAVTLP